MKKNFLVLLITVITIAILLSIVGYKTFCTLEQRIDWDAVTACSTLLLFIITTIAVIVAIIIPQKHRFESSKIELFKIRFDVYFQICQIIRNGFFTEGASPDGGLKEGFTESLDLCKFLLNKSDYEELFSIINDGILKLNSYTDGHASFTVIIDKKKDYIDRINKIFDKYLNVETYGKS